MAPLWSVAFLHPQIERLWLPRNGVGLDSLGLNPGSIVVIVSDSLGQSLKFSESWFLLLQNGSKYLLVDDFPITAHLFQCTHSYPLKLLSSYLQMYYV